MSIHLGTLVEGRQDHRAVPELLDERVLPLQGYSRWSDGTALELRQSYELAYDISAILFSVRVAG